MRLEDSAVSFAPRRSQFRWRLRTRSLELGPRTLLMGILNVTPDSFSDGSLWLDPSSAVRHGLEMLDGGADLLDLGGESTRPGAEAIAAEEEQARMLPVLRALLAARQDAVLSVDTYHASTARLAVEAGAEIVNDVSGHLWDPKMSRTCAELGCGIVLMHTRGRPQDWRSLPPLERGTVVPLVLEGLRQRAEAALAAAIARDAIVLDPGFGFGKAYAENLPLLAHLKRLHALGFPVLAGVSRKGFLRKVAEEAGLDGSASLAEASSAAHMAALLGGAHLLRVHEVGPARVVAAMADSLLAEAAK